MTTVYVTKTVKLDEDILRKLVGAPSGAIVEIQDKIVKITWNTLESIQPPVSYYSGGGWDR